MNDHHADVLAEMGVRMKAKVRFVLPTATVVETGNHVFQIKDGAARRTCAAATMSMLRKTALGEAPWVLHERTWDGAFLSACAMAAPRAWTPSTWCGSSSVRET